jgi:hypothetical protein
LEWVLIIIALVGQTGSPIVIDGFKDPQACNFAKGQIVYNLRQMPNVSILDSRVECMPVTKVSREEKKSPDNPGGPFAN